MEVVIYFQVEEIGNIDKLYVDYVNEDVLEDDACTTTVVKMSIDRFKEKRWFIVFYPDCYAMYLESDYWFQTDEDPVEFIKTKFIHSRQTCQTVNECEECEYMHAENMKDEIDIGDVLCNNTMYSPRIQSGLRIVNANEKYPDDIIDLPNADGPDDHYHMIYVYDTIRFQDDQTFVKSRFHLETLRKINEYNCSGGPIFIVLNLLVETYLNKYCPVCKAVFLDWTGCTDLVCSNSKCEKYFCGYCLMFATKSEREMSKHSTVCKSKIYEQDFGWSPDDACAIEVHQTSVRFDMMKEAISLVNRTVKNKIIRKLYQIAKGTLMKYLIFNEYKDIL